ncbi:unnamed protein product, partial [Gadus morhua 'NCC']
LEKRSSRPPAPRDDLPAPREALRTRPPRVTEEPVYVFGSPRYPCAAYLATSVRLVRTRERLVS